MTHRMFVLATIAVLALGFGLMRLAGFPGPSEPPRSAPGVGEQSVEPTETRRTEAVARPIGNGATVSESGYVTTFGAGADWPNPPEVGDPLDPDEAGEWAPADSGPIDIGPELDADDPWVWESYEAADVPIEIGSFLDAGAQPDQ